MAKRSKISSLLGIILACFGLPAVAPGPAACAQITTTFLRPVESSDVAAAESGVIREILVAEGSSVRRGDPLARLNDAALRETENLLKLRAESDARVRSARSMLELRKTQLDSLHDLRDKGHAHQRELDQARIDYDRASAELQLADELQKEAQIELRKVQAELEQRLIRSPIDGVVTQIHKQVGEYIAANDPVFCTIVRLNKLKADFYLDASLLASIKLGDELPLKIDGLEGTFRAKVVFRSPIIDPKSGTGRIEVELDNVSGKFTSGTRCELRFDRPNSTQLPRGVQR